MDASSEIKNQGKSSRTGILGKMDQMTRSNYKNLSDEERYKLLSMAWQEKGNDSKSKLYNKKYVESVTDKLYGSGDVGSFVELRYDEKNDELLAYNLYFLTSQVTQKISTHEELKKFHLDEYAIDETIPACVDNGVYFFDDLSIVLPPGTRFINEPDKKGFVGSNWDEFKYVHMKDVDSGNLLGKLASPGGSLLAMPMSLFDMHAIIANYLYAHLGVSETSEIRRKTKLDVSDLELKEHYEKMGQYYKLELGGGFASSYFETRFVDDTTLSELSLNTKDIDGKWSEDFGVPSYLKEYNRLYQTTKNSSNRPSEFRYVRDRLAKTHDRLFELALDLRRSPNLDKLMKLQAENDAKQALNNNIIKYV